MSKGYMGKLLFVDLTKGEFQEEILSEELCRDFMGGYGIGAWILYERMKPKADPLGPDNLLGFMTGPLTGTPHMCSGRYVVIAKSPLTGTWGDANSGGDFGPNLKFAGFDGVFFTGASSIPIYLYIENGKPELRDATQLWGKDCLETEDMLTGIHGKGTNVACIGPAGENMSLLAAIINDKGRAAGRSGIGAVMGSKKLKVLAVKGNMKVPMADEAKAKELRRKWIPKLQGEGFTFRDYGTCGGTIMEDYLKAMDCDTAKTKPSSKKIKELGLSQFMGSN